MPGDSFSFTAPSAATYTFDVTPSNTYFEALLEVRNAVCNGAALGCSHGSPAQLSLPLAANQKVVVVAGSNSGRYTLSIR